MPNNNDNQLPADNDLNQVIYAQLRNLTHNLMVKEHNNHILSPTDLVHEAYLKISDSRLSVSDEKHYFIILAKQMRMALIDYALSKQSEEFNQQVKILFSQRVDVSVAKQETIIVNN